MKNTTKTTYMALCGLFAALTAICSWISIPLGFTPVPINLATLAVLLAGGILGAKYGAISLTVYVLIGAVGAPVFAGFRGGLSVLAGPTGGYIIGYIAAAFLAGLFISAMGRRLHSAGIKKYLLYALALLCALLACYAFGTFWFMFSTNTGFIASLLACVIPFVPGEIIKISVAVFLIHRLRKFVI